MLGVILNKFSIGKETYHPHSAELHYYQIDKKYWAVCFERIKKAGFRIISTSVPWSVHMVDSRTLDFSGQTDPRRDLVVFLELAREFAFKIILRPGPRVGGPLENGGLPKHLFADSSLIARNAAGEPQQIPPSYGIPGGPLPSYLHPGFQFNVKNFMRSFIEVTKNYVHPRGPVFMVELDYETSFGNLLDPASADYNPDVLTQHYPPFLESRFDSDIKKLNAAYKEKHDSFAKVSPPMKFSGLDVKDYPKVLDWFRFREYSLNTYLRDMEDVFTAYTVEPLLFRSLYFRPGDLLPAFNLVPDDRSPFLSTNVFPGGSYFDILAKARYLQGEYGFAYASSYVAGGSAADPIREAKAAPISEETRRFYFGAAVAAGFRGMNHYMFVDRDKWYGAPLMNDGAVSDGYELARLFTTAMTTLGTEGMQAKREIALVGNRLYNWLNLTESPKQFPYLKHLMDTAAIGFGRDVVRLKHDFAVRETRDIQSLAQYKVLFIPITEMLPERDQQAIIDLAKGGTHVILCGVMPRVDEQMQECLTLSNHFRIKTTLEQRIGTIEYKGGSFVSYLYGSIRTTDDAKTKKIAKAGASVVGVTCTKYKGALHFFSFDISSGGNHHKLAFVESVLAGCGLTPYLYCSDPSVDVAFQCNDKRGLLTIVSPPPGELSDGLTAGKKHVILKADLKEGGFKATNLKLVDVLAGETGEVIKISAKDLQEGIGIDLGSPDGKIFVVEKRQ